MQTRGYLTASGLVGHTPRHLVVQYMLPIEMPSRQSRSKDLLICAQSGTQDGSGPVFADRNRGCTISNLQFPLHEVYKSTRVARDATAPRKCEVFLTDRRVSKEERVLQRAVPGPCMAQSGCNVAW